MMNNALVVDCSPGYNLGAERLAVWLRNQGASVQAFRRKGRETPSALPGDLDLLWADEVYLSVIYSWDLPLAASVANQARRLGTMIKIGGPAAEYNAEWVEAHIGERPWRGVHPCADVQIENPRMTWTSRGCIRRCDFCIVWRIEGDDIVELPDEQWTPAPMLMDNNFLACSEAHQERVIRRLAASGLKRVDFNQGLDARLYTPDFRRLLEEHGVTLTKWRFAYDNAEDWTAVQRAIEDVQAAGVGYQDISVYVLYNYRETPEDAIARCECVIGDRDVPLACPWPMAYKPLDWMQPPGEEYIAPRWTARQVRDVRRYYSRPQIWRSVSWEDYNRAHPRSAEAQGYPADWDQIAGRVKARAGWRCEHCGHSHDPAAGYTLTVHHIDGHPANCVDDNLVALCQRCHLRWQQQWTPAQTVMDFARPAWMTRRGLG